MNTNQSLDAQGRINNSALLNHITAARGTKVCEGDTISFSYGYTDVQFWLPSRQAWIHSQQDFVVTAPDFESAKQEFWDRWQSYIERRFALKFVRIETI